MVPAVSRVCSRLCCGCWPLDVVVSSVVVVLVCANASGVTSPQTKAIIVFFTLILLDSVTPKFVSQALSGRSWSFIFSQFA